MSVRLDDDVQFVKGVGPRRARALADRGIRSVEDLLHHLPTRYEDRAAGVDLSAVREGETITFEAVVVQSALQRTRRRGFSIVAVLVQAETGSLRIVFFNRPYLEKTLARGVRACFHGRIGRAPNGALQLQNPDFEVIETDPSPAGGAGPQAGREGGDEDPDPERAEPSSETRVEPGVETRVEPRSETRVEPSNETRVEPSSETRVDPWKGLVPIHPKLPGFTPRGLRRVIARVLDELPEALPPTLPPEVEERRGLMPRREALRRAHFPPEGSDAAEHERFASEAHRRLVHEELFAMQVAFLAARRRAGVRPAGRGYETSREVGDRLRALLPFRLTAGQRAAFRDVVADLTAPAPMARLLQGDVGSGKTIVALLAMLLAAESGHQAALMAPTEILAEQHARAFRTLLGDRREVALLTGGIGAAERRDVVSRLADGALPLVVGTHALIQEAVSFHRLALIVVDEQHRFGTRQRLMLASKADRPDVLVMSATPIPRTLALSLHGDLDVSTIPDRPPGRQPVRTAVRSERARGRVLRFLEEEIARGRQVYVVHPLIEETEEADLRAATEGAEELSRALPGRRVGLVHGRIPAEQRDETMRLFAAGELDALVATTVVEVGVDVANASVMMIENAERFGLAQLHQLRGRVGRGPHRSYCILMSGRGASADGRRRLDLVASSDDGFLLAEHDLKARGAGELFGARQVGVRDLRIADPLRDRDVLEAAREDARRWLGSLDAEAFTSDPLLAAIESRWRPAVEGRAAG